VRYAEDAARRRTPDLPGYGLDRTPEDSEERHAHECERRRALEDAPDREDYQDARGLRTMKEDR
jgi:hypothetical protein